MPPTSLVLVPVLLDQKRLPGECRGSLNGRESIRRNAKDATTAQVNQSKDGRDQNMRGANEAECAVVNTIAHERGDSARESARENNDVKLKVFIRWSAMSAKCFQA